MEEEAADMGVKLIVILGLVGLAILVLLAIPDRGARVVFCDVGQGDGILVVSGYSQMIIDSGSANGKFVDCLSRHLPFWDKTIEVAIMSHWDEDHSGGLEQVLSFYKIENIYSGTEANGQIVQKMYSGNLTRGDMIRMGLIEFEVESPRVISGDSNKDSIVGVINYNDKRLLLMGDVNSEIEQGLVWRGELPSGVDILKVSHHGSGGASCEELLDYVGAVRAVVSVGKDNKYGHPNAEVIRRLEERGVKIHRTDLMGELIFEL